MIIFKIKAKILLDPQILYCSPLSYCSFNFAKAKVLTFNSLLNFFVLNLFIDSWLLFSIALCVVIATISLAIVVAFFKLKGNTKFKGKLIAIASKSKKEGQLLLSQ